MTTDGSTEQVMDGHQQQTDNATTQLTDQVDRIARHAHDLKKSALRIEAAIDRSTPIEQVAEAIARQLAAEGNKSAVMKLSAESITGFVLRLITPGGDRSGAAAWLRSQPGCEQFGATTVDRLADTVAGCHFSILTGRRVALIDRGRKPKTAVDKRVEPRVDLITARKAVERMKRKGYQNKLLRLESHLLADALCLTSYGGPCTEARKALEARIGERITNGQCSNLAKAFHIEVGILEGGRF